MTKSISVIDSDRLIELKEDAGLMTDSESGNNSKKENLF